MMCRRIGIVTFARIPLRVNARIPVQQAAFEMHLIINGEDHDDLPDGLSLAALIAHLGLPERKIAIERNREVVSKSTYDSVQLENHDKLEIIHFIGGG